MLDAPCLVKEILYIFIQLELYDINCTFIDEWISYKVARAFVSVRYARMIR